MTPPGPGFRGTVGRIYEEYNYIMLHTKYVCPIYKEDHYTLLHTKYESFGSCDFGEEGFFYVFP